MAAKIPTSGTHDCLVFIEGLWIRGKYEHAVHDPQTVYGIVQVSDIPSFRRQKVLDVFEHNFLSEPGHLLFSAKMDDAASFIPILDSETEYV